MDFNIVSIDTIDQLTSSNWFHVCDELTGGQWFIVKSSCFKKVKRQALELNFVAF